MIKIILRMLIALAITSSIVGCQPKGSSSMLSLSGFTDSNLVGIWQAQYSQCVEILLFNKDGTYLQIYEDKKGFLYRNDANTWKTEKDPNGRVFIHLNGGLWFPEGEKIAQLKGMDLYFPDQPHSFYDPTAEQLVTMLNELILEVIPRRNSKGFVLFQFMYDIDLAPEHFEPAIK